MVENIVRKHCEKRKNCLLQAISPFPTIFSTAIYQNAALCGNGLTLDLSLLLLKIFT